MSPSLPWVDPFPLFSCNGGGISTGKLITRTFTLAILPRETGMSRLVSRVSDASAPRRTNGYRAIHVREGSKFGREAVMIPCLY